MTTESIENELAPVGQLPEDLAGRLVAAAKTRGLALTGPGGLLTGLTKQVLETPLEVEMAEHLGHDRGGARPPATSGTGRPPDGRSHATSHTNSASSATQNRPMNSQPPVIPPPYQPIIVLTPTLLDLSI